MIVEIADLGIGMSPADILDANERLAAGGEMSADTARRMGLFVVSRISRRYNISVRLRPTATSSTHSGITATVLLPTSILDSSGTRDPHAANRTRAHARSDSAARTV
ncbi:ATP-binding protein [Rhodococcus sp. 3Y1]